MIVKKAILHIMDFNSDVCVFSNKELDTADYGTSEFIDRHLVKIMADGGRKDGEFLEHSAYRQLLERYLKGEISFTEFAGSAGTLVYDQVSQADQLESMDVLLCQFSDEGEEYMGLMLLPNKIEYTHLVESSEEGPANKIIRHFTLLPNTSQKISCYGVVRLSDLHLFVSDKKREINGEDVMVLPDRVLQCAYGKSDRDTIKVIKKVTGEVADEYGANSAVAVSRAKNFIIEASEQNVPFTPFDLCEEVFGGNEVMKNTFRQKAVEADIPATIAVENPKVVKSIRTHKIKTDTGIEITIPTDYLENSRYVEFINNPDGTISIQLKQIGKIINR